MNLIACDNERKLSEQLWEHAQNTPVIFWRLQNVKMWDLFLLISRFS